MRYKSIRRVLMGVVLGVLPTKLVRGIANHQGHVISPNSKIGFSFVCAEKIVLGDGARIGHFSFIKVDKLLLRENARIDHLNWCTGPFDIWLKKRAVIGNRNIVSRAPYGVTVSRVRLRLGELTKITASHSVDCTSSVIFGDFTILAGKGSQVWTHGYVHDAQGEGRYRIDGAVEVGDNVYIGSASVITGGVQIVDNVIVGAGVSVAKSLIEPGLYVSSAIRKVQLPGDPDARDDLSRVEHSDLIEKVYMKKRVGI